MNPNYYQIQCIHCPSDAAVIFRGKFICEDCADKWVEHLAELDGPDPHGDRDPSPEEQAGWAMQDKIDMYRNEF